MSKKSKSIVRMMDELFERMESSINEILRKGFLKPSFDLRHCCLEPLIEISETADNLIVVYDLPYIRSPDDIEIKATPTSLELDAQFKEPVKLEKWGTVQKETEFKHYHHVIRKLPVEVVPDKATSRFKQGLLEITLPKVKPHKIKVE
ncbi:Hsp20/alpha crystallin family protein [Candidatus Borrarchaeum sp.]|uniref:Hsp20/alpha crystallin family protein n=1 Tax=Candidatus Borrarchaeum sp. TaxID=2846742 RepID=UPI00257C2D6B|nr:Hsp20/alpha crystallin family protein [Candidatus Borrarchaeum sp.]